MRQTSNRIGDHIRSNLVGYAALLVALSGTAYASHLVVRSSDIVDDAIVTRHIRDDAVVSGQIRNEQVRSADVANDNLSASDLGIGSTGLSELDPEVFAAGDIALQSGGYGVANDAVQSAEVSADTLTGADINEKAVGLGSTYAERTDSVKLGTSFQTVLSRSVTTTAPTQLNAVATANLAPDAILDGDYGAACLVEVDGLFRSPEYVEEPDELDFGSFSVAFGRTVFPGSHTVALRCRQSLDPNAFVSDAGMIVFAVPLA
jgi:hypothetical protein